MLWPITVAPKWVWSCCTLLIALMLLGVINASAALFIGMICAQLFPPEPIKPLQQWSSHLIKLAIIFMGLTLSLRTIWQHTQITWMASAGTIALAFVVGSVLQKWLGVQRDNGWLITIGTAICGGSAIASLAPVIRAQPIAIITSISIVFLLNAIAIFAFPAMGSLLNLSPEQFGWWAALAIHDTSSVVGAAASYDINSVPIATTAKLARSLWIIPIVLLFSLWEKRQQHTSWPWFIAGFLGTSAIGTLWPLPPTIALYIKTFSNGLFAVALFGIGSQFHQNLLRNLSWRPLLMAVLLWLLLASTTLIWVTQ